MSRDLLISQFFDSSQALQMAWKTRFFDVLNKESLTPGQAMTLFLLKRKQPLRGSDIAKEIRVTRSAITQVMEGLYKLGYVERTDDEQDRRNFYITLTARGEQKVSQLETVRRELFMKAASGLSDTELAAVNALNAKMAEALEK